MKMNPLVTESGQSKLCVILKAFISRPLNLRGLQTCLVVSRLTVPSMSHLSVFVGGSGRLFPQVLWRDKRFQGHKEVLRLGGLGLVWL